MRSVASSDFPTGSPTYDFYGVDRLGSLNLFSDRLIWPWMPARVRLADFQIVYHDLWDYDLATAPKLLTVKHDGRMVDVVAQPGKTGFLYVFDRVTGKPPRPIQEMACSQVVYARLSRAWPTQPFPTVLPPFANAELHRRRRVSLYRGSSRTRPRWRDLLAHVRN